MRKFSFLALTTFILSAIAQDTKNQTFIEGADNYIYKTEVTDGTQSGFTIEYKNYYKVVTNVITNKRYCLVGWNRPLPSDCSQDTSFSTPVTIFNIESDAYSSIPFVELLGLQSKLANTISTQNITSPCIMDGSKSTTVGATPQFVFSQSLGHPYVSFSGDDDSLAPLQKASWILYVAAFFDLEVEASTVLNTITTNYNCHKNNVGATNPKKLSWTYYDPLTRVYTIRGDNYFTQLASDAGGVLSTPNRLQNKTFTSSTIDLHSFALDIQGSDFIIDESRPSLQYDTWYKAGGMYLQPNSSYAHVKAIADNNVYTINGLVNANNASDWSQRSAARPDLALLDLIKLFYPTFSTTGTIQSPIWLTSYPTMDNTRKTIQESTYGSCNDMLSSVKSQTVCVIGGNANGSQYKNLSSGDKAGISVGAILFVIVAVLVGIWLFRKYRRNQRHNFYRMNDL